MRSKGPPVDSSNWRTTSTQPQWPSTTQMTYVRSPPLPRLCALTKPGCETALLLRERTEGPGTRSPSPSAYLGKRRGSGSRTRQQPEPDTRGGREGAGCGSLTGAESPPGRPLRSCRGRRGRLGGMTTLEERRLTRCDNAPVLVLTGLQGYDAVTYAVPVAYVKGCLDDVSLAVRST